MTEFTDFLLMIFDFCISFIAYIYCVFFIFTFQTFPKPPLPTGYITSNDCFESCTSSFIYFGILDYFLIFIYLECLF